MKKKNNKKPTEWTPAIDQDIYTLTRRGGSVSWSRYKKNRNRPISYGSRIPVEERTNEQIWTSYRRRITKLSKKLSALKSRPRWFITLHFDRKVKREWMLEECLDVFEDFRRYLDRAYPNSWFIWVMEWSPKSGFHYHILGRFGIPKVKTRKVRKKWMKLTGSNSVKSAHFEDFVDAHFGYVMKREKAKNTCYLIRLLGYRSFFGFIHAGNMRLHLPESQLTTGSKVERFKHELRKEIPAIFKTKSTERQLRHMHGCLNLGTSKPINAAFNRTFGNTDEDE